MTTKENPHAKWLRMAAGDMAADNRKKWANTCAEAADEIDRLTAEVLEQCRLNGLGSEREAALMGKVERLTARVAELEGALKNERSTRRWNMEITATGFRVCKGEHEKSEECDFVDYVPATLLERPQEASGLPPEAFSPKGNRCLEYPNGCLRSAEKIPECWPCDHAGAPHEPQGWQPIETAPEGRDFMAWIEDKNGVGWMEPRCCLNEYGKFKMWTWELDYGCEYSDPPRGYTPTHWMPLPSAPVTKEGDA